MISAVVRTEEVRDSSAWLYERGAEPAHVWHWSRQQGRLQEEGPRSGAVGTRRRPKRRATVATPDARLVRSSGARLTPVATDQEIGMQL